MNRRASQKSYVPTLLRSWMDRSAPTRDQLLRLVPHLTIALAEQTLLEGDMIATPPVYPGENCYVVWFQPAYLTNQLPKVMVWSSEDPEWHHLIGIAKFRESAESFAKRHWWDEVYA